MARILKMSTHKYILHGMEGLGLRQDSLSSVKIAARSEE